MQHKIKSTHNTTTSYLGALLATDPLREQINSQIVNSLDLPRSSKGLDIGCGIGTQSLMIVEHFGPGVYITGLDIQPEFLRFAINRVNEEKRSSQLSFSQGDFHFLPFRNSSFDWAWSADCIAYGSPEPVIAIREMVRVVKPGGSIIILFWSSAQLLPGYPVLEAHLAATSSGVAPFLAGQKPEQHSFHAMSWLKEAGLTKIHSNTFVATLQAPLSVEIRKAIISLLDMRWYDVESELSENDYAIYQRITSEESPDFIVDLPDYYAFFTYSFFRGSVP